MHADSAIGGLVGGRAPGFRHERTTQLTRGLEVEMQCRSFKVRPSRLWCLARERGLTSDLSRLREINDQRSLRAATGGQHKECAAAGKLNIAAYATGAAPAGVIPPWWPAEKKNRVWSRRSTTVQMNSIDDQQQLAAAAPACTPGAWCSTRCPPPHRHHL